MGADELTWAVGELATLSTQDFDAGQLLRRLCEVAARSLGVDGVGVMHTDENRRNRFVHASDPRLAELEALQEALQEGPCRDAVDSGGIVTAASIASMRWSRFVAVAVDTGVQAVLAVPLISRGRSWGTLDLYWRTEHAASDQDRAWAQLLADVAVSYLVMADDRARSRDAHDQLARRALHDSLTGLPNRDLLHELIDHGLASAGRRGTFVAVLFLDLDGFKAVNDTFGHRAGDVVLQVIARRLQSAVRAGDTVGRISGDEFLVVCEDITDPADVSQVLIQLGNRIRLAVCQPIRVDSAEVTIFASIGIAVTAEQPSTAELIHRADAAMYRAKALGGNDVVVAAHGPRQASDQPNLPVQRSRAAQREVPSLPAQRSRSSSPTGLPGSPPH